MRIADGELVLRLLPEHGLDIAEAWLDATQVAWLSGVGFDGPEWGGGLLRTCGLQNVGAASDGFPLHGQYHGRPAELVEQGSAHARAVVCDGPFRLERELRVEDGVLTLTDVTENVGQKDEQAPILYHVNLGPALWSRGGALVVDGLIEVVPRDRDAVAGLEHWSTPPEPQEVPERVFEHRFEPEAGWGQLRVRNERTMLEASVRWKADELPRLHQWVDPSPGFEAFGVEPANCSVLGREADRAARAPFLGPGEIRTTVLELSFRRL